MLETVVVSPYIVSEPSWTLGDLAELMFFYKEVKLYISEHTLDRLVTRAGGELTVRLIEDGYIECHYMREMVALHNLKQGQQFVAISLPGHSTAETIQAALYKGGVPGRDTRRMARRIADKVRHFNYAKEFAPGLNMLDQFRMDLGSEEYVRRNFVSLHNELWPGQPLGYEPYFRLRMVNYKGGIFKIETNMRFNDFESSPRSDILMLEPKTLSAETFAFSVNAATFDTFVAAQNRADVLTSDLSRIFCANRLLSAASVLGSKSEALARFQELVFPEGRTISVVVGNDRQKFAQFIDFVESKEYEDFENG